MLRDEYYKSKPFIVSRLLGNETHELRQQTQRLYDILHLYAEKHPHVGWHDKFHLFERQLRVVQSEISRLITFQGNLDAAARPLFDDFPSPEKVQKAEPHKCPVCEQSIETYIDPLGQRKYVHHPEKDMMTAGLWGCKSSGEVVEV